MKSEEVVTTGEISFNVDGQFISVPIEKLWYFKSFGNYIKIITEGSVLITKQTTHEMEAMLPEESFLRIHKSFIINVTKIQTIGEDIIVMSDQSRLPIGKTFKRYVKKVLMK